MRTRTSVLLALAATAGLSLGLARPQPDERRPAEILSQIVDLRLKSLEHERTRRELVSTDVEPYIKAYTDWADARVRLARAQGDAAAEREALNDLLGVLRERVEEMAGSAVADSTAQNDAQIAVLECELRIQRLGARRGGGGAGDGGDSPP